MAGYIENLKFRVPIIIEADGPIWHVYSPAFKSLHVDGRTLEDALQLGRETAKSHLQSLIETGQPIPLDIVGYDAALDVLNENSQYFVEEIQIDLKCKRGQ
jgi:predicted RNase H-like HicB family nuclease